jgi:hypothetical protein
MREAGLKLKGEERWVEKVFVLFFLRKSFHNLFNILNSFQSLNTSNPFQNFQTYFENFQNNTLSNNNHAFQIMMHKHLLLLKLFKSDI